MSNIINVKEEHNVLSFTGDVLDVVANSTNFYLCFDLDDEWDAIAVVTAVFDFDGEITYVELDANRKCAIPPTRASKILFCITASPDSNSKLSSTILSLNVEGSGETDLDGIPIYVNTHTELLGLIQDLENGNVNANHATTADSATTAGYATSAGSSETQVSLTGDETIAGAKNFTGSILHNNVAVLDASQISNQNFIINGNFIINTRGTITYTRSGTNMFTADRWQICDNNGKFNFNTKKLTGLDSNGPVVLKQWIEDSQKALFGKTIAVGATIDGTRYTKVIEIPSAPTESFTEYIHQEDTFSFSIYLNKTTKLIAVQFSVVNGSYIVIDQVKVEISNTPTAFVSRTTAEELTLCQRYYQRLKLYTSGYPLTDSLLNIYVSVPTTLRLANTMTISALPTIIGGGSSQVASNIVIDQNNDAGIILTVYGTGFSTSNEYYVKDGYVKIDGEIY